MTGSGTAPDAAGSAGQVVQRDSTLDLLANYARSLDFGSLSPAAVRATKVCIIDALGVLIAGFFCEPGRVARNVAARLTQADGATVLGTAHKTSPDMAAFVNAAMTRTLELNDIYHRPGIRGGHPSDALPPVLSAAEHVHANGRDFITAVALTYEVMLRIADETNSPGFDSSPYGTIAIALVSAKLFGLPTDQLRHAVSMAAVPHNALHTQGGHTSMWVSGSVGQAGRDGVFAAMLARDGMEGPGLPFEHQNGWFNLIAGKRVLFETLGGNGTPFKIEEIFIKPRPTNASSTASAFASEAAAKGINHPDEIEHVLVEVYKGAKERRGSAHAFHPTNRETAAQSIPYIVAVGLHFGRVTHDRFDDAHLANAALRATIGKTEVVENPEFTNDYNQIPMVHRARVTVRKTSGEVIVGNAGGGEDDLGHPRSDEFISNKFSELTQQYFGLKHVSAVLDKLWNVETMTDVGEIPRLLAL